ALLLAGYDGTPIDSGLDSDGQNILLSMIDTNDDGVDDAIVGKADGVTIFTISVNATTGSVTVTQTGAIDHPTEDTENYASDSVSLGAGLVSLQASATIEDDDGDTATDSESVDIGTAISFTDVGPTVDVTLTGSQLDSLTTSDTTTSSTDSASFATAFGLTSSYGADGAGTLSTTYALLLAGYDGTPIDSGLDSDGQNILLSMTDTNDDGVDDAIVGKADGVTIFTISVNATTGSVTVTQTGAIDHPTEDTENYASDSVSLGAGLV